MNANYWDYDSKKVGKRIKKFMDVLGISPLDLSVKSKVSLSTITNLERNLNRWNTIETYDKIAEALGVELDDLFFDNLIVNEKYKMFENDKIAELFNVVQSMTEPELALFYEQLHCYNRLRSNRHNQ